MRILEAEIDLREETRALEQAHDALEQDRYVQQAQHLGRTQEELHKRLGQVMVDIRNLPEGSIKFRKELQIIGAAVDVMAEATGILNQPDTGPEAIAAETEVIELLLQSKRCNPNGGGGGGGASPGGGGGGDTDTPALALYGPGADARAQIQHREVRQSTGTTGRGFPAEFREGLDSYFNAIENDK